MRSFFLVTAVLLGFATVTNAAPGDASGVRLFVRHEVSDYAAWRKVYDGMDATRQKMGVTAQAVYRSTDDPNDVTVSHDFKTAKAAKAFAASAELKTGMEKAGVKGAPQIWYTKEAAGRSGQASHLRMFVRHEVSDYATWRKTYDGFGPTQQKMGVTAQSVYQGVDDPNDVTVYHDFKTVKEAKIFAESAELRNAMQGSGVKGAPTVWFTTRAAK